MLLDYGTHYSFFTVLLLLLSACSSQQQKSAAHVRGRIMVADSIDSIGDYSGISVTIIKKDSAQASADTLYYQVTDSSGHFEGQALFQERRFYTLLVDRNKQRIGRTSVILAENDSVYIEGVLPDLGKTLSIQSNEHDALKTFRKVNTGFQHVARYISLGALQGDSLANEIRKWSDLYWEVYLEKKGTLASRRAVVEAIRLYKTLDGQLMMAKLQQVRDNDALILVAAQYAKEYLAETRGLDYTLKYLDTLQSITRDTLAGMNIYRERIKLLYDSARIGQAKTHLADFKKKFGKNRSVQNWVESIDYDLNYLSPGDTIPSFSFRYNGKTVSRDSLLGTPYILEMTLLANELYQNQYDRTFVIHTIYKNFGLQVVTIPLDRSQITIDAFFQERDKAWPVASADAFNRSKLIGKFNIRLVPVRFLVDRDGKIVRKYIGREYSDVIQGIQTLIKTEEPTL